MSTLFALLWLCSAAISLGLALTARISTSELLGFDSPTLRWLLPLCAIALTIDAMAVIVHRSLFAGMPIAVALSPIVLLVLWCCAILQVRCSR